ESKLHRVIAKNFVQGVANLERVLSEYARSRLCARRSETYALAAGSQRQTFDLYAGNAEIRIARIGDLIVGKARKISAQFVEHRCRDRANPCHGRCRVDRLEPYIGYRATLSAYVAVKIIELGEVRAHCELIVGVRIEINAAIELSASKLIGSRYESKLDVWDTIQPAPSGIAETD